MSDIEIRGLCVNLDGKNILRDLSCSLPQGKVIGLIGPNGAGKSTLLRSFFKLVPASGDVRYDGKAILELSSHARADLIAFLPQERELAWAMSVKEVVALGLPSGNLGKKTAPQSDEEKLNAVMELVEITHLKNRAASSLSGGELARVLIARTLAQETPIIVADEPLAGLDPEHQIKVMKLLNALAKKGRTVIASIHDLTTAALWCDHLIVLHQGRLRAEGSPKTVLTRDLMKDVYQIEAELHERNGRLFILPIDILA